MMETVDKLRECLHDCRRTERTEQPFETYWITASACDMLIDGIEREIAERYMELPLDADGVPIRVGDEMESDNERFVICAVAPGRVHRWEIHNIGELDKGTVAYPPTSLHHFKPRTIVDVLADFAAEVEQGRNTFETAKKYADELRELMGVDE